MTASEELDGAEGEAPAPDGPQLRVAVLGISEPGPCGMRDHGRILTAELEREGISCELHWLERTEETLTGALREAREWARALPPRIEGADAVLLHYSWAAAAYRGLPLLEPLLARALRHAALPVVAIMHELVFPFGRDGARGAAWALSSRAALLEIAAASDALLVTTEDRRAWVASRRWLPRRPVAFAPVFSNLPAPGTSGREQTAGRAPVLALFGFLYDGSADVVLRALRELSSRPDPPRLLLVGSPGPDSRAGRAWVSSARELGVAGMISFTGLLEPQELSDTLAGAEVLLFADPPGPTSRKGTLAGSLASGTPVLALDGHSTWARPARSGALRVVPRDGLAMAAAIAEMLDDGEARAELGAQGRRFAQSEMGAARTAAAVRGLLAEVLPPGRAASAAIA
jgi:glycosyltransferase involved in cell wall biosynthesis